MNYNEFQIRFNKELKSKIHRDVFFDSLFIGGAIAATIILQLIAPFFFAIFYEGSIFERLVAFQDDVVALSLLSGVTLVIPFAIVAAIKKPGVKDIYTPKLKDGGAVLGLLFAAFGATMAANLFSGFIVWTAEQAGVFINAPEIGAGSAGYDVFGKTCFCFFISVIPAICEEFAFRVVTLGMLRKYGDGFAIVVSSLLFSLLHGNFEQIPFAFLCGLALGYVAVATGSVFISMAVHFGNNFISTLLTALDVSDMVQYRIIILFVIIGIIAAILLRARKKLVRLNRPIMPATRGGLYGMFFVSPLTLISSLFLLGTACLMLEIY